MKSLKLAYQIRENAFAKSIDHGLTLQCVHRLPWVKTGSVCYTSVCTYFRITLHVCFLLLHVSLHILQNHVTCIFLAVTRQSSHTSESRHMYISCCYTSVFTYFRITSHVYFLLLHVSLHILQNHITCMFLVVTRQSTLTSETCYMYISCCYMTVCTYFRNMSHVYFLLLHVRLHILQNHVTCILFLAVTHQSEHTSESRHMYIISCCYMSVCTYFRITLHVCFLLLHVSLHILQNHITCMFLVGTRQSAHTSETRHMYVSCCHTSVCTYFRNTSHACFLLSHVSLHILQKHLTCMFLAVTRQSAHTSETRHMHVSCCHTSVFTYFRNTSHACFLLSHVSLHILQKHVTCMFLAVTRQSAHTSESRHMHVSCCHTSVCTYFRNMSHACFLLSHVSLHILQKHVTCMFLAVTRQSAHTSETCHMHVSCCHTSFFTYFRNMSHACFLLSHVRLHILQKHVTCIFLAVTRQSAHTSETCHMHISCCHTSVCTYFRNMLYFLLSHVRLHTLQKHIIFLVQIIMQNTSLVQEIRETINPLPNDKILDRSKLKAFPDDKINVTKHLKFGMGRVENIVGNGENAGYQHFLLLSQCFQKAIFLGLLKVGIVW